MTRSILAAALLLVASCAGFTWPGSDIDRVSVVALRQALFAGGLTIIDVRDPKSWKSSDRKIPGAVREDPFAVAKWRSKYERTDRIVLYCS